MMPPGVNPPFDFGPAVEVGEVGGGPSRRNIFHLNDNREYVSNLYIHHNMHSVMIMSLYMNLS